MSVIQFQECDTCAAKPGSPTLCSGCLSNRLAIGLAEDEIKDRSKDFTDMVKKCATARTQLDAAVAVVDRARHVHYRAGGVPEIRKSRLAKLRTAVETYDDATKKLAQQ